MKNQSGMELGRGWEDDVRIELCLNQTLATTLLTSSPACVLVVNSSSRMKPRSATRARVRAATIQLITALRNRYEPNTRAAAVQKEAEDSVLFCTCLYHFTLIFVFQDLHETSILWL